MKKKSLMILLVAMGLILFCAQYALAASGLSQAEESILSRLEQGFEVNGEVIHIPPAYRNQAENELIKNEMDLSEEQVASIIGKIDEAASIVKNMDVQKVIETLDYNTMFTLLDLVEDAAEVAGYETSVDIFNRKIDFIDSDGQSVFTTKEVINQTGFDMTSAIITVVILGMVVLFIPCMLLGMKLKYRNHLK